MKTNLRPLFAVGILEDNEALRTNIECYINTTKDYFVSFSEPRIETLFSKEIDCCPDYILLDIHLEEINSIDLIGKITARFPETSVIIMTGDRNEEYILKAFQNGAKGYLNKPFTLPDTIHTMDALRQNGSYLSPDTATKLISLITKQDKAINIKERFELTERENDIVMQIKNGLSYQEIADKLFISYHTVNYHIKNLYVKMNVNSRAELIATYLLGNN